MDKECPKCGNKMIFNTITNTWDCSNEECRYQEEGSVDLDKKEEMDNNYVIIVYKKSRQILIIKDLLNLD